MSWEHFRLIYIPIMFFLLGSLIIAGVVYPATNSLVPVLSLFTAREAPVFSETAQVKDIFQFTNINNLPTSNLPNEYLEVSPGDIPAEGEWYGIIISEAAGINARLYYGDSPKELMKGVGTYNGHPGAYIPGAGRTVLLAGHAHTVFQRLGDLKAGNIIYIDTTYGRYMYRVTASRITTDRDSTAYDFTRTDENLILYTCYPFNTYGLTNERYFVYAEYLSGPELKLVR